MDKQWLSKDPNECFKWYLELKQKLEINEEEVTDKELLLMQSFMRFLKRNKKGILKEKIRRKL